MTKNSRISVVFNTIIKQDLEITKFSLNTHGTLVKTSNLERITFEDTHDGKTYQMEVTIFSNQMIRIKQIKPIASNLEFDSSKKTFANYLTEYGSIDLAIRTSKLVYRPGSILIEYLIEDSSAKDSYYILELSYKETN
jgi:uncharacterized beta-barrel protein YwiB (DUF1934 family)